MAEGYLDLLTMPQRVALGLAGDALKALDRTVRAGTAGPEEIVRQLSGLLDAVGGLAAATAQPMQDFVSRQRELADTVATLAQAQADLAEVFAKLAAGQAEVAAALEKVTAPALGLMGATAAEPTPKPAAKKAPVTKAPAQKTARNTTKKPPAGKSNRKR